MWHIVHAHNDSTGSANALEIRLHIFIPGLGTFPISSLLIYSREQ